MERVDSVKVQKLREETITNQNVVELNENANLGDPHDRQSLYVHGNAKLYNGREK